MKLLVELDRELTGTLRGVVQAMNTDNFIVRPHREHVEKYREADRMGESQGGRLCGDRAYPGRSAE